MELGFIICVYLHVTFNKIISHYYHFFQIQTQGYLKMKFTKNTLALDIWKMIVTFAGIFFTVKCFSVLERFVEAWNKYVFGAEKKGIKVFTKCQLNISAFQNYNIQWKVYLLAYLSFKNIIFKTT